MLGSEYVRWHQGHGMAWHGKEWITWSRQLRNSDNGCSGNTVQWHRIDGTGNTTTSSTSMRLFALRVTGYSCMYFECHRDFVLVVLVVHIASWYANARVCHSEPRGFCSTSSSAMALALAVALCHSRYSNGSATSRYACCTHRRQHYQT